MTVLGFKMSNVPAGMTGRWIIGELVGTNDHTTTLKRVCNVFDFLEPVKTKDDSGKEVERATPVHRLFVDEIVSHGNFEVRHAETEGQKAFESDDPILKLYQGVIESYRFKNSGIIPPAKVAQATELLNHHGEPN